MYVFNQFSGSTYAFSTFFCFFLGWFRASKAMRLTILFCNPCIYPFQTTVVVLLLLPVYGFKDLMEKSHLYMYLHPTHVIFGEEMESDFAMGVSGSPAGVHTFHLEIRDSDSIVSMIMKVEPSFSFHQSSFNCPLSAHAPLHNKASGA
jgi:hypothetical protein